MTKMQALHIHTHVSLSPTSTDLLKNSDWVMRIQTVASQWNSTAEDLVAPPHWHDTHDEIHRIIQGRIEMMLGSESKIYTPEDGEIFVPRGVVQSLRMFKGEDLIFEEKTQPMVRTRAGLSSFIAC